MSFRDKANAKRNLYVIAPVLVIFALAILTTNKYFLSRLSTPAGAIMLGAIIIAFMVICLSMALRAHRFNSNNDFMKEGKQ